jgi:hypothetical protein
LVCGLTCAPYLYSPRLHFLDPILSDTSALLVTLLILAISAAFYAIVSGFYFIVAQSQLRQLDELAREI